jgi:hypothetical protein
MFKRWEIAKQKAVQRISERIAKSEKLMSLMSGTGGNVQLVGAAVSILVIIIVLMVIVYTGSELEDAADVTTGSHWHNITNLTGEVGEAGASILKVGVILAVIFSAVGFLIWPYIEGALGMRRE